LRQNSKYSFLIRRKTLDEVVIEKIKNYFSDRIEEIKEGTFVPSWDNFKDLPEFSGTYRDNFIKARNGWYKQIFNTSFKKFSSYLASGQIDLMSQSDLAKMFECPINGNKGVVHLIKLTGFQILAKIKCPSGGVRLLKIPLRLGAQCVPYFRDSVYRCFKCGQKSTVDLVKHSGPWTLIKLNCPTHGNNLPTHKIWSSIYVEISGEGIAKPQPVQPQPVQPQQVQPQPIPSVEKRFCRNCGERFKDASQKVCQNCGTERDI
jgi:hypothetical protein